MANKTLLKVDPRTAITAGAKRIPASVAKQLHDKLAHADIEQGETCSLSLQVALDGEGKGALPVKLTEGHDFVKKSEESAHPGLFLTRKGFNRVADEIGKAQAEMKGGMQAVRHSGRKGPRYTDTSQWGYTGEVMDRKRDHTDRTR